MKARLALALMFAAAACRVGPEHRVPEVHLAAAWTEPGADPATEPVATWWRSFGDAHLDALVERALANNIDIQIAATRVREARALRAATAGAWDPQLSAGLGVTRSSPSTTTNTVRSLGTSSLFDAGFDARWEIDLFGRREHAVEAADANIGVAIENRNDAVVSMLGEIARNYIELRGLQRQIAITRSNLELQRESAELTRRRFEAGFSNELDVARSEALIATTTAQIPSFESAARAALHTLSVLIGETPGALALELESAAPVPEAPATVATGLPSELLRRRPDVRAAERELARATAQSGAAIAAQYPSFSLSAALGQQSRSFAGLFDADSDAWSAGGSLVAPILNGGTLKAEVAASEARADAARLGYRKTVIAAVAEVESALAAVGRERSRRESLATAVAADRRAVTLVNDLYTQGIVSFFEVLEAQQSVLRSESSLAASDTDLSARTVALYKALGGGWEVVPAVGE